MNRLLLRLIAIAMPRTSPIKKVSAQSELTQEPPLPAILLRADAFRDMGNAAAAAEAYREAVVLSPDRADLLVQLGNMLKDSDQFAAAEIAYRKSMELADVADTHLQLGHLLKSMGNRDGAISEYRRAVSLDSRAAAAVQELAEAGARQQQERRFDAQLRGGGVEALLTLSHAISVMRADLERLSRFLPQAQAQTAFPIGLYDVFRAVFPIPAPPAADPTTCHIVILAEREEISNLFTQISAVQQQASGAWVLSVLGHDAARRRVVELAAVTDRRIVWVEIAAEVSSAAAETAFAAAVAEDWVVLMAPGAVLDAQAIAWIATAAAWSGADALVFDEETGSQVRGELRRSAPVLRQVVDFDSLLEHNGYGETIAVRRTAAATVLSGLPVASVSASRSALLLGMSYRGRVGHLPYPLVWRAAPEPTLPAEHQKSVAAHLVETGLADRLEFLAGSSPIWRPQRPADEIAVIIATRDNAQDLTTLVHSLRETAGVPDALTFVIVDNGSLRPDDVDLLGVLAAEERVSVVRQDVPFNWSHLNNQAVERISSPLLLFANDDMRMITTGWDVRLRGLLERPDVGAVGARLLYEDDTLQHAGVLFGWKGSSIHDGLYEAADEPGPTRRWHTTRAVGAVTGAFLAIRRELFVDIGCFDAAALPVAYSDLDLALRLRAVGLKVLWTPAITLYHHESKTRGLDHLDDWRSARNAQEHRVMEVRWGEALACEPGVHPFWHAATLPFRLLSAPSDVRVREHITRTGSPEPWHVQPTGRGTMPGTDA